MKNVSFTNDIGQTIEPGAKIVAVTVSSHSMKSRVGTYLGMSDSGNCCIVSVMTKQSVYIFKDNGEEAKSWNDAYYQKRDKGREYEVKWLERPRKTVLFNNVIYEVK